MVCLVRLSFLMLLALASSIAIVSAQPNAPIMFADQLPPIPKPPYNHDVRFCGIADGESFALNGSIASQCDWKRYGLALARFAAPPIGLAGVALICSIIVPFVLCCACCKKQPIPFLTRILLAALFGSLLFVGFVLLFVGNAKVSNTVNSLSGILTSTIDDALVRFDNISTIASQLPYTNDSATTFNDFQNTLNDFKSSTVDVSDRVKTYDRYRKAAIFVGALVPLVLVGAAVLLAIFNIFRPLMGLVAWLVVFLSMLVWLCMCVHLVIGKVLSDVCWEVELAAAQGEAGALSVIIRCQTDSSPLNDLRITMQDAVGNATSEACNVASNTCETSGPVVCPPMWDCNATSIEDYPDFNMTDSAIECDDAGTLYWADPTVGCPTGTPTGTTFTQNIYVRDCPTICRNPVYQQQSVTALNGISTLVTYLGLTDQLDPLLSCKFVADAFFEAKDAICDNFQNSLTLIFVGATLEALGMGLAMASLIHFYMGLSGKKNPTNPQDFL